MKVNEAYKNAFTEVYEILNLLENNEYSKHVINI